jgi:FixJ family two-component response regulator
MTTRRCAIDMHMPGMTGIELIEMLRSRGDKTPAILITAAADPLLRTQGEKLSSFTFLDKPVDGDKLLDAIASETNKT